MSSTFGPAHRWFAWHPVNTDDQGWKWLQFVWRRRQYLNIPGGPAMRFWEHTKDKP